MFITFNFNIGLPRINLFAEIPEVQDIPEGFSYSDLGRIRKAKVTQIKLVGV